MGFAHDEIYFQELKIDNGQHSIIQTCEQQPLPQGIFEVVYSSTMFIFKELIMIRKHIRVTCGIIEQNGLVLAVQRSNVMSMPLMWEFPGGKIDIGESSEECLVREIEEELGVIVDICERLPENFYVYPDFDITLIPFVCCIISGTIILHEHAALAWLHADELSKIEWAPADVAVVKEYCAYRNVQRQ